MALLQSAVLGVSTVHQAQPMIVLSKVGLKTDMSTKVALTWA